MQNSKPQEKKPEQSSAPKPAQSGQRPGAPAQKKDGKK